VKKIGDTVSDLNIIICGHCHKQVLSPELVGLTLVCPHCKLAIDGQYPLEDEHPALASSSA